MNTLLPDFSSICPEQIVTNLQKIIEENRSTLKELITKSPKYTWECWMQPLEELDDSMAKFWIPVSHLYTVAENEALSTAYQIGFPLLTEYLVELSQNKNLYDALENIKKNPEYTQLNQDQRKAIDIRLQNFKLSGVDLKIKEKKRFVILQKNLSKLMSQYSENVYKATQAWVLHIENKKDLVGLDQSFIDLLQKNAERINVNGWVITLEHSCYSIAIKYLCNRELRQRLYEAYTTRASDQGPHAGRWDNTQVINDILNARHEVANILGFSNYAEYSLATKMVEKPEHVLQFLNDLTCKIKRTVENEINELTKFASEIDKINYLEAWDIAYYTERFSKKHLGFDDQLLRPFFPIHKVLTGLFTIANKIFGIHIVERHDIDKWHPTVQCYEVFDKNNELYGYFYIDLYARPGKREGAWLDPQYSLRRRLSDGNIQHPIAFLISDISRPIDNQPTLLNHYDIVGIFHEFGHCLHHLLTNIECRDIAGMKGVPWDFVEFPSQFMEHWCWEVDTFSYISEHIETKECLPDDMCQHLLATKYLHAGIGLLRQLQYALFDFRLHLEYNPKIDSYSQTLLSEIYKETGGISVPDFCRTQHSFLHIFDERYQYAAGFYSYLWAAVLASDAYSKFEETGIFNFNTGQDFLKNILSKGGSQNPMDLFVAFRNRPPSIDAYLRHHGLCQQEI